MTLKELHDDLSGLFTVESPTRSYRESFCKIDGVLQRRLRISAKRQIRFELLHRYVNTGANYSSIPSFLTKSLTSLLTWLELVDGAIEVISEDQLSLRSQFESA